MSATHQPNAVASPNNEYYGTHENVDKTGTGAIVSSENEHHGVTARGEEVLERDAATKGRWFAYVKTKQFWITLLLGQGTSLLRVLRISEMQMLTEIQ